MCILKVNSDRPDVLGLERWLLADELPLVPGFATLLMVSIFDSLVVDRSLILRTARLSAPDRYGFLNTCRRSKGGTCHGRGTTRHISRCRGKWAAGIAKVLLKVRIANILGNCCHTNNGLAQGWNLG
jgi:hypothetical protein